MTFRGTNQQIKSAERSDLSRELDSALTTVHALAPSIEEYTELFATLSTTALHRARMGRRRPTEYGHCT